MNFKNVVRTRIIWLWNDSSIKCHDFKVTKGTDNGIYPFNQIKISNIYIYLFKISKLLMDFIMNRNKI